MMTVRLEVADLREKKRPSSAFATSERQDTRIKTGQPLAKISRSEVAAMTNSGYTTEDVDPTQNVGRWSGA